jgi:hypothetical protein
MNPAAVGQLRQGHRRALQQGIVVGQHEHHLLPAEPLHPAGPVLGRGPHGDVAGPVACGLLQSPAVRELQQADLDLGMAALPVAQHRRQDSQRDRAGDRHLQLSHLQLQRPAHHPARALCVGERRLRLNEQLVAGGGQAHTARQALQQRAAQLGLERADLLGQRGLGDEQPLRRLGEGAELGDRHEVLQLAEVHVGT